ncbi:PRKC apoptosis WT1 regulator protein [Chiloscyllium punctatum]|uniref:PRKC apoptosis WT1 regulator protein n=1 Tax=Chiloscyllium punctatum TaxID=137246 RepID=UPI003B63C35A
MASGGYRPPGNTTDFLEEWKAKREKMRARFAAATGANSAESGPNRNGAPPPAAELSNNNNNNGGGSAGDRERAAARTVPPINKRLDEDGSGATKGSESGARNPAADEVEAESPSVAPAASAASSASPPASSKIKEKGKSSGPSARKGKGQIEKRKLREKRRSTGVVNIPSTESPDDDDHSDQKLQQREDAITQQNTLQNESITSDPNSPYIETPRTTSRWKSTTNAPEEDITAYSASGRYSGRVERPGYNRYGNASSSTFSSTLEKKLEEFEKELAKERQENQKLVKLLQDRDDLIGKLKEEIDLLNRDLDEIEDENDQLKQENKTLLKVVGQLTR